MASTEEDTIAIALADGQGGTSLQLVTLRGVFIVRITLPWSSGRVQASWSSPEDLRRWFAKGHQALRPPRRRWGLL
jgi:hypothetical protein